MITGLIFDVDGTILDSMPIWDRAGERYLAQFGIEAEPGLNRILFPMSMEEGASYLQRTYKLQRSVQEIVEGINQMIRDFYAWEVQPKEGALELMRELKKQHIKMAAATATDRCVAEPALRRIGMLRELETVVTCSEIGASKNAPDIYEAARTYLGTERESTWVMEDSLNALKTARKAGFRTIGVYDAASRKEQEQIRMEADIYCKDLCDRRTLIQKLQSF